MNYKEALELARKLNKETWLSQKLKDILKQAFPELTESEDEGIKRELIEYVKTRTYREDWVAWLEKQGEQKESYDTCVSTALNGKKLPYGEKRDFGYFENQDEQKSLSSQEAMDVAVEKCFEQCEQKHFWSEDDDRIYYSLLADIRSRQDSGSNTLEVYYNEQMDWLKSLKQRIGG